VRLRFIYLGMIAEVAGHAGHADILAEQVQAAPSTHLHRPAVSEASHLWHQAERTVASDSPAD